MGKKISYLDGLRGVAAFIVVFHHFILAFYPALFFGSSAIDHLRSGEALFMSGSVFNILYNGNFAVCIFFVLSGFVLSHKFLLQKDHSILTESAVKRYVRLAVPVAFSVFCAFVLMELHLFYNQQAADLSGSSWLGSFWNFTPSFPDAFNQAFYGTFFGDVFTYNATLWTIAQEFLGSFLIFGFLAFFGRMRNRYWAYLFAILFFLQTYYLAFILGMLLSDLVAHGKVKISRFDKHRVIRTLMLVGGVFLGSYPSGRAADGTAYALFDIHYFPQFDVLCHVIGAFLIILVLLDSKLMQRFFSLRYFIFLGEISFSMYLLHFLVLGSFSSLVFVKLEPHMSYAGAALFSFASSVGLIFAVAYLSYRYVDRGAIRLSKLVYQRIFSQQ